MSSAHGGKPKDCCKFFISNREDPGTVYHKKGSSAQIAFQDMMLRRSVSQPEHMHPETTSQSAILAKMGRRRTRLKHLATLFFTHFSEILPPPAVFLNFFPPKKTNRTSFAERPRPPARKPSPGAPGGLSVRVQERPPARKPWLWLFAFSVKGNLWSWPFLSVSCLIFVCCCFCFSWCFLARLGWLCTFVYTIDDVEKLMWSISIYLRIGLRLGFPVFVCFWFTFFSSGDPCRSCCWVSDFGLLLVFFFLHSFSWGWLGLSDLLRQCF